MWFQRIIDSEPPLPHHETPSLSETTFHPVQRTVEPDDTDEELTTYQRVKLILFRLPADDLDRIKPPNTSDLNRFVQDVNAAVESFLSSNTQSRSQGTNLFSHSRLNANMSRRESL